MLERTRCGCHPDDTNYRLVDITRYPDTGTLAVTTRADCCGRTWTDEMSQAEFDRTWGAELEGPQ